MAFHLLGIPIKLHSLLCPGPMHGISTEYSFQSLPYFDGTRDFQGESPFLSSHIRQQAFSWPDFQLRKGLHLHWNLPPFLQRSARLPVLRREDLLALGLPANIWQELLTLPSQPLFLLQDGLAMLTLPFTRWETELSISVRTLLENHPRLRTVLAGERDGKVFPPVPNRWWLQRFHKGEAGPKWLIQSDFIHPKDGSIPHAVAIPDFEVYSENPQQSSPCRYIGRQIKWEEGMEEPSGHFLANEAHALPLDATGYGYAAFSTSYPACHSVFGAVDEEIHSETQLAGLEYRLVGEYSSDTLDYWAALSRYLLAEAEDRSSKEEVEVDTLLAAEMKRVLDWEVNPKDFQMPDKLCFSGLLRTNLAEVKQEIQPLAVSIGNSANEAISAMMADWITADGNEFGEAVEWEDFLESLFARDKLERLPSDLRMKFRQMRHRQEFRVTEGGHLWSLHGNSQEAQPDEVMQEALTKLNQAQLAWEKSRDRLQALRAQLWADWQRYLHASYPTPDVLAAFPDPDETRLHILNIVLPRLKDLEKRTGQLLVDLDEENQANQLISRGYEGIEAGESFAEKLEQAYLNLKALVQRSDGLHIRRVPGPRFHQAREPVMCLMNLPHSHSLSGTAQPWLLAESNAATPLLDSARFPESIVNELKTDEFDPLFLEWQADYHPLQGEAQAVGRTQRFNPDHLFQHFHLPDNSPDLQPKLPDAPPTEHPETIQGRSYLEPEASVSYQDLIQKQLESQLGMEGATWDEVSKRIFDRIAEIQELEKQAAEAGTAGPSAAEKTQSQEHGALLMLSGLLMTAPTYTQSLTGFHAALTGRQPGWQLPVMDPQGFPEYRDFASKVSDALRGFKGDSPLSWLGFHPWRSGKLSFKRLRLVDRFGRFREIQVESSIAGSHKLNHSEKLAVNLPPRLCQPARLEFRFLPTDRPSVEKQNAPDAPLVHGWVIPNFVERSIHVLDDAGKPLVQLESTGPRWENDHGFQGSAIHIGDQTLRNWVEAVIGRMRASSSFLLDLLKVINEALEGSMSDDALFGPTLAIAQARLNLHLQGSPFHNLSWDSMFLDIAFQRAEGDSMAYENVLVPFRLGEHHQLQDGLVMWWRDTPERGSQGKSGNSPGEETTNTNGSLAFHLPQNREHHLWGKTTGGSGHDHVLQAAHPIEIGLLMLPERAVHVTSGILPVKQIELPVAAYDRQRQQISGMLYAGPVLNDSRDLRMPLPKIKGQTWQWVNGDSIAENPPGSMSFSPELSLPSPLTLKEGWLRASPSTDNDQNNS